MGGSAGSAPEVPDVLVSEAADAGTASGETDSPTAGMNDIAECGGTAPAPGARAARASISQCSIAAQFADSLSRSLC